MFVKNGMCLGSLTLLALLFQGCPEGREGRGGIPDNRGTELKIKVGTIKEENKTYNFYIENSGSVKGYFKNKDNDAVKILKEFYDRIDEEKNPGDKITFNYINNKIEPENVDVQSWLNKSWSRCTEQYSDLDKVISQALNKASEGSVNFVLSDYAFVSKDGNLANASSEIRKVFTKALNKTPNTAIAIYKYSASFDGIYYPGAVPYIGKQPLYLWIFGPNDEIKHIHNLRVRQKREAEILLQKPFEATTTVVTKNARMYNKDKNCVNVSEWKKERDAPNYKLELKVDLKKLLLSDNDITDVTKYEIQPEGYRIEKIEEMDNGIFKFVVSTAQCSAGSTIRIERPTKFPRWVSYSNHEIIGKPIENRTYGIKYLIEGVHDAFYKNYDYLFIAKMELK